MAEQVTSHFPAMGEGPFTDVHDPSGERSPYTKTRARQGPTSVGPDSVGGKRSQTSTNAEVNGPVCRPSTTIAYAQQSDLLRNVRIVPSRAGVSDMWAARAEGPVI
jgi:hypothetical protein